MCTRYRGASIVLLADARGLCLLTSRIYDSPLLVLSVWQMLLQFPCEFWKHATSAYVLHLIRCTMLQTDVYDDALMTKMYAINTVACSVW